MELYAHQKTIIDADPKKCGIFYGTGSGKSLVALSLAQGRTLVICPKTLRDDRTWERNLEKLAKHLELTVVSKEEFKKLSSGGLILDWYETVIIDEAHTISGVTPTIRWKNKKPEPKCSQLYEACHDFLQANPPERLYLLTATPTRNPMAVYALGKLLGKAWDFYEFRSIYYVPVKMNFREIWMQKKDAETQERLGKCVRGLGYTGKLDDWMDVPPQTHRTVHIPLSTMQVEKLKELPTEFPDPLVLVGKKHQVEQGVLKGDEFNKSQTFPTGKIEAIKDLWEEFPRILIFAKYTEQIRMLQEELFAIDGYGDINNVFILDGQTKDRGEVIEQANKAKRCVVIAQSSVSAGYELPSFRCTVFASESYSYVDHAQAIGRTLRANNLQKNLYVYLVSGEIDKAVRKAIDLKGDFNEAIYAKVI